MPQQVGRYRIERRCGRGAMGAVFEAFDPELDRQVALKLLERSRTVPDAFDRLERQVLHEARAMARLHHPAVASVYEVGRDEPWLFIAMEFIDGPSLRQYLEQRPSWRKLLHAFIDVGRGLAAGHRTGLAHGDLKPDNLRFDAEGQLRILDFGLEGVALLRRAVSFFDDISRPHGADGLSDAPARLACKRRSGWRKRSPTCPVELPKPSVCGRWHASIGRSAAITAWWPSSKAMRRSSRGLVVNRA